LTDLLDNPAIQAALVPFSVALVLGFLLARTRFLALAVVSGVVAVTALTVGLSLEPLTSVKKLVLTTLVVTALALALESSGAGSRRAAIVVFSVVAGAGAVWTIARVLQQMDSIRPWAVGAAALVFVLVVVASALAAGTNSSLRGAVVGACLGWGSGVLALLGASALLAQIGLAVGTACAAVALVQMLRGSESPLGWTLVVPAAVTAGLVGVLAAATGELPWYCLIPLPFAPFAAWWTPVGRDRPAWQRAVSTGAVAVLPVALSVGLAWWTAASPNAG
jgi:hypothetical protein